MVLVLILLFFIRNAFRKCVLWHQKYHLLKPSLEIKISFVKFVFVRLIHVLAFLKLLLFLIWIQFSLKNLHQKYSWNWILDSCFLLFFLFDFVYFLIFKFIFGLLHWMLSKKIILFLFILRKLFLFVLIPTKLIQKLIILKWFIFFLVIISILILSLFFMELVMEESTLISFFLTFFLLVSTNSFFLLINFLIF